MGKTQYSQRFRKEWLRDNRYKNWLLEVPGDDKKGFCKFCKCSLTAKLCDIEKHRSTNKHKKAEEPFSTERQTVLPFKKLGEAKKVEGTLAMFVAEHCSIRVVDHLSEVCKVCFNDSKAGSEQKLKRSKCSGIICNILAPHFTENLKSDVGDRKFSLIIDESIDVSTSKMLGIVIRYYSDAKKCIVVTFLDLVELTECSAEAICEVLKKSIKDNGLDVQNLLALGTDNASVMTGINSGEFARLKAEVPHLQLIKCVCHSLQLSVSHTACEKLPRHLEFMIKEIYNWFSHSSVRQIKYKELYETINDGAPPLKLIQLSQTRWLSIERAVARILQQWVELRTHFQLAKLQERCYTAELLYSMLDDEQNRAFLLFLKPVLAEVQAVNLSFEAEVQDPTKLMKDLVLLVDSLDSKILTPGKKISDCTVIEEHLDPKPYLGFEFEKKN